jgi:hypothetical protein
VPYRQQVDIIQAFALRGLQEDWTNGGKNE